MTLTAAQVVRLERRRPETAGAGHQLIVATRCKGRVSPTRQVRRFNPRERTLPCDALYFDLLIVDQARPDRPERNHFILSNGPLRVLTPWCKALSSGALPVVGRVALQKAGHP